MNTKELRLKNYIKVNGELQEVVELPLPDNCVRKNTKGIQISEKWLLVLGFDKFQYGNVKNDFQVKMFKNGIACYFKSSDGEWVYLSAVKYVHQLQNLFFDITGEELTKSSKTSKIKNHGKNY